MSPAFTPLSLLNIDMAQELIMKNVFIVFRLEAKKLSGPEKKRAINEKPSQLYCKVILQSIGFYEGY